MKLSKSDSRQMTSLRRLQLKRQQRPLMAYTQQVAHDSKFDSVPIREPGQIDMHVVHLAAPQLTLQGG